MNFKNGYPIVLLYYFTLNIDQIKGLYLLFLTKTEKKFNNNYFYLFYP